MMAKKMSKSQPGRVFLYLVSLKPLMILEGLESELAFSEQMILNSVFPAQHNCITHSQLRQADVGRKQHWQCFEARVMEISLRFISIYELEEMGADSTFTCANGANQMLLSCIFTFVSCSESDATVPSGREICISGNSSLHNTLMKNIQANVV